ncbi:DPP IV N-terminal domain-containing protein [SAR92 clade bacterium H231]|nr:DPP IV N-terminal domain-containing protein [SAR92 clade bacterium H231]
MDDHDKNVNVSDEQSVASRYQRAEAFEHEVYTESMVLNAQIFPHWVDDSHYFWYVRKSRNNDKTTTEVFKEFRLVNAETATNSEVFDHQMLAQKLAQVTGRNVDPKNLPISELKLDLSLCRGTFLAFNKHWAFDNSKKNCEEIVTNPAHWLISPDERNALFLRDYNLWVRDLCSGEEQALTQDGECYNAYAVKPERVNLIAGLGNSSMVNSVRPEAVWSPDSKSVLTLQVDERQVLSLPVTQYVPTDGSLRPRCIQTKYALPGDKHIAEYRILAIDVETGQACRAHYPPVLDAVLYAGLFSGNRAWWSKDSRQAYFIDMVRGQQQARVVHFNTQTGATRVLFEEISDTHIDLNLDFEHPAFLLPLPETNELIWFSERSGWAHLYLYDLEEGILKNPITSGDWLVREVLHFDAKRRELLIQVAGRVAERDPYYREICRVNVDTGIITSIGSDEYDYLVCKPMTGLVSTAIGFGHAATGCSGISADGHYIVTTRTRADEIPITELIDREGKIVLTIETADLSGLPDGWQWPEPVKLLAADGKTDIYGLVFRPSNFSPEKNYPVLNWAFNNPFYAFVPKGAFGCNAVGGFTYMSALAYAELGFITVLIDGRGSCYRSKDFHNEAYGKMHTGSNLEDQIAGIRQLAERYPYMDLGRVGITDVGGSNSPVYGLLAYPDFYKVGTVYSVWDIRLLAKSETYQGLLSEANYKQSVLSNMAGNLKGKLLLMHGLMDPFFPLSGVFQLVDSLVKENKNFDLVLLPNGGHSWNSNHYGLRRIWDYLVTHLLGDKPPPEFQLSNGVEFAFDKLQAESQ